MVKKGSGHRTDGMRAPVSDILPAPFPCMFAWNLKEAKFHEKMRKTLSLILALVLAFSLAAVPAFAADTTEAETSTSDTAYANGWVGGYADGTFHPNQTITRAEAVTILNRVLGRSCDLTFVQANAQAASHFTDVTPGAWYYAAVTEASVGHTFTELTGIERWTAIA